MAVNIFDKYGPTRASAPTVDYPAGSIKNESVPGANDGTPLDQDWANDYAGFDAALFTKVGLSPDGNPDTAQSSQRLDAFKKLIASSSVGSVDTVSDITSGALDQISVGDIVETKGYYVAGDGGGGPYINRGQGWPVTADELINHSDPSGNFYELQYVDGIYVEQAGARKNTDDSSFSDALQAIVDFSGNPSSLTNANTIKAKAGIGTFFIKKPVYINAIDGFEFESAGLFKTNIKVSPTFTAGAQTVPPSFPSDGLDYEGSAMFVFARQRVTGRSGQFIIPGSPPGAGAAWYYKITGFYIDAESTNVEKAFDVIRAPEIANLWLEDVLGHKIRRLVDTDDNLGIYSSTFNRVQTWYSVGGIKGNRGTSLLVNQCALIHSDEGWNTRTNYSTYNSTTIDNCEGVGGNYAWDLGGIGVVMNGCGCEFPKGGVFRAQTRGTQITVNGGFLLGGSKVGEPNYTGQADESDFNVPTNQMIVVDGGKVDFVGVTMRAVTEAVPGTVNRLKVSATNGGRAIITGNTGEAFGEYVQNKDWLKVGAGVGGPSTDPSRIDFVGETAHFEIYTTADETIPRDGTEQITFSNFQKTIDLGPSYFDNDTGVQPRSGAPYLNYTIPMTGIYEFTFQAFIDNIDPGDYIYFQVTGQTNRIMTLSDFPDDQNLGQQITVSDKFFLNAEDTVTLFYRTFSTTIDPVIKEGARFFGGICN